MAILAASGVFTSQPPATKQAIPRKAAGVIDPARRRLSRKIKRFSQSSCLFPSRRRSVVGRAAHPFFRNRTANPLFNVGTTDGTAPAGVSERSNDPSERYMNPSER